MVTLPSSSLQIKDSGSSCNLFTLLISLLIFSVAVNKQKKDEKLSLHQLPSFFSMGLYFLPPIYKGHIIQNKLLYAYFLPSQQSPKCKPAIAWIKNHSKIPPLKTTVSTFIYNTYIKSITNSSSLVIGRYTTRLIGDR